jgi:chromate transporter
VISWPLLLWGPQNLGGSEWLQLLGHFLALSLLAVGGAITTVPDMQRFVVQDKSWLSEAQFSNCIALGQATPGPNVLFVAVIGFSVGGLAGVLACMVGTLLPSTTLAWAASRWGEKHRQTRAVRAFSVGLAPLTVGLLLATAWILLRPVVWTWAAALLVVATLWLMLRSKRSPVWVMAAGAAAGALGWV